MTAVVIGWSLLVVIFLALLYVLITGGGPPSADPHDSGCGGAL